MTRIAKPKPCPFCGSIDVYMERQAHDCTHIQCNNCYAHGPALIASWDDVDKDTATVMRLWNGRKLLEGEVISNQTNG